VKGDVGAVTPVRVVAVELTVAQGPPAYHTAGIVVLLPQVLEHLSFSGQGAVCFFLIKVPVQIGIDLISVYSGR